MHETGAFRFAVRGAAALAPAVVVALLAGPELALVAAALGIVAAVAWTLLEWRGRPQIRSAPRHLGPPDERRILVVADDLLSDDNGVAELVEEVVAGSHARVLLLAPLRVSTLRRWTSDTDDAHAALERRLAETAAAITCAPVSTALADDEPLQAIEDALHSFGADEIVVAGGSGGSGLASAARGRFAIPVASAGR